MHPHLSPRRDPKTQPRNATSGEVYNAASSDLARLTPNPPNSQQLKDMQRSTSRSSLYSTSYSFYQYNGLIPSPAVSRSQTMDNASKRPDRNSTLKLGPLDYLQLGIECHEANQLKESFDYFKQSATEGGGCGVGMLMYGLSLCHGWGCKVDRKQGFQWVQRAAESAVGNLENLRTGQTSIEKSLVQEDLVVAIYELAQCYFHGWGVAKKKKKLAVSYYRVAAQLGNGDAQGCLAFCLENGKGCKRDKKEAARWYRAAVDQGLNNVGLAWIYKEKYQ